MLIKDLAEKKLIHPPKFLIDNTHYLVQMGSVAYGVSTDASDMDLYGFAIPYATDVFPHLDNQIHGFGTQKQAFNVWQEHHVRDGEKEYDFAIYNIVSFFDRCMGNNPNMIDALFVPQRCVFHQSKVALHVRENRKLFLHKGSYHKFTGYAYSQLHKIRARTAHKNPKRQELIDQHGFDTKFGYHIVRLALEIEQILETGDLNLEANSKILRAVRNGEWSLEHLEKWFAEKEIGLEKLYHESTIPYAPDEPLIKNILMQCLEMHFGDLSKFSIKRDTSSNEILRELELVIEKYR